MRLILTAMTALLVAISLISGSILVLGGMVGFAEIVGVSLGNVTESAGYPVVDNVMRFLGGLMFTMGLGFGYCLFDVQNKTVFFRFLLLAIFLGGLVRLFAWSQLGVVQATIPSTAIELIFPPLMYYFQSKLTADIHTR